MIILAISIGVLVAGILLLKNSNGNDWKAPTGFIAVFVAAVVLFMMAVAFPVNYLLVTSDIVKHEEYRRTINEMRNRVFEANPVEGAAIFLKILNTNAAIADYKYWNERIWDLWIPDKIMNVKPIK